MISAPGNKTCQQTWDKLNQVDLAEILTSKTVFWENWVNCQKNENSMAAGEWTEEAFRVF